MQITGVIDIYSYYAEVIANIMQEVCTPNNDLTPVCALRSARCPFLPGWVGNKNMRLLAVETSGRRERYRENGTLLAWFLFAARLDAGALPPSA